MSKKTIWVVIAISLILIGAIMFVWAMLQYDWDFSKLNTQKYETNTYDIREEFGSISINTDTADIKFLASTDEICKVVCYEQKNINHSVDVEDNTLNITVADHREWHEHIGINFNTSKITVYLPKTEYTNLLINGDTSDVEIPKDFNFGDIDISLSTGDVKSYADATEVIKIKTSTGDISLENISAGALRLSVSTGKTNLTNVSCKSIISSGDTGDIYLKNVIATDKFDIERDTGDVKFENCDAAEISIETDTGDVKGSLLSDKVFIAQSDTGSINVPKTTSGGRCEITTDTGDIRININK